MSTLIALLPLSGILLLVGVLIGSIGIGGVLLVPSLTYLGDIEVHVAIASCSFSYLFTGAVGGVMYARKGSIKWSMAGALFAGAMPGAFLGAVTMANTPGAILELIIAALVIFAGIHALVRGAEGTRPAEWFGNVKLFVIGLIVGYGSALSGTGGPLILVPILVWLELPVLTAIGLSQVIQLPVAILASIGNVMHGTLDFTLGLVIAVVLTAGAAIGAWAAHKVSAKFLKRVVAVVLIAVGILIAGRIGHEYLTTGTLG